MKAIPVISAILIFAGVAALFMYFKKKKQEVILGSPDNFEQLKQNLGNYTDRDDGNSVGVVIKNNTIQVDFYNNSRLAFSKSGQLLSKGSYYNGGKKIVMDSLVTKDSQSVWQNINSVATGY